MEGAGKLSFAPTLYCNVCRLVTLYSHQYKDSAPKQIEIFRNRSRASCPDSGRRRKPRRRVQNSRRAGNRLCAIMERKKDSRKFDKRLRQSANQCRGIYVSVLRLTGIGSNARPPPTATVLITQTEMQPTHLREHAPCGAAYS
jgi:hypothetical protein